MSLHTLPFLYINLGGEMLYVLNQRLEAQGTSSEKRVKVMSDIIGHMISEWVMKDILAPKPLPIADKLKDNFNQLAHCSIMKLGHDAMDKLFDLMGMSVKYQVLLCKSGQELLQVTLNHLDGLRQLVKGSGEHTTLVDDTQQLLCKQFGGYHSSRLMLIRHTLLAYFQDSHKKVSIFLAKKMQLANGRFVLPHGGSVASEFEIPGTIRYVAENTTEKFVPAVCFTTVETAPSIELRGNRRTKLGLNIFKKRMSSSQSVSKPTSAASYQSTEAESASQELASKEPPQPPQEKAVAKAELDLLQHLLIRFQQPSEQQVNSFRLNLFDDEPALPPVSATRKKQEDRTIKIDTSKKRDDTMDKIIKDFTLSDNPPLPASESSKGDDLLSLMDAL